jgi:SET domain-containing protein
MGYFALEDIKAGETIADWTRDAAKYDHHLSEIMTWERERRRKFFKKSYQVDDEVYNGFHEGISSIDQFRLDCKETDIPESHKLFWCLNHCCVPNAWYVTKDLVVAKVDIKKGEEICYDYASILSIIQNQQIP